jgi:hypothetical protein
MPGLKLPASSTFVDVIAPLHARLSDGVSPMWIPADAER